MLGIITATQPTNEISAAMQYNNHCCRDTCFFLAKTEALSNELFWPQASMIASLYCTYLRWHSLACKLFIPWFNMASSSAAPCWWGLSIKESWETWYRETQRWKDQTSMLFLGSCYDVYILLHDESLKPGWGTNRALETDYTLETMIPLGWGTLMRKEVDVVAAP